MQENSRSWKFFNYGRFAVIEIQAGLSSYKIIINEWPGKTNPIGR
jgi:hypothetical protein